MRWLAELWPRPTFRRTKLYDSLPAVPDRLRKGTVAVIGGRAHPKWVAFDCPCPRRHRIVVPASGNGPRWTVTVARRRPTIRPSIDSDDGERCHYFITRGHVRWV